MKNTLVLLILLISFQGFSQKKAYKIKLKIKGMQDSTCFLVNYWGGLRHYKDTAKFNTKGTVIFEGKKALPQGVYGVVTGGVSLFEIIIAETDIELETDTIDYVNHMKVIKSEENKLYFEYSFLLNKKHSSSKAIREKLTKESTSEKEKKEIRKKLAEIGKEINAYRLSIIKNHPNTFNALFFKTMKEPKIPNFEEEKNDSIVRILKYEYLKTHFWDEVDFSDERINNTPLYHNKLEKYFNQIIFPRPDSINKEVDYVINKAKANKALFKYTVRYLNNKYEKSKIMGMDAVTVHISLNYYTHDLAFWIDSTQIEQIQERAKKTAPLLIGKPAINLSLMDTSGVNWINMYRDLKTDYTILIFWTPTCGHCKQELPKLAEYYKTIKDKSVSVYSVCPLVEEEWKKFIREHNLDFDNVAVPTGIYQHEEKASEIVREYITKEFTDLKSLNYKDTYDVYKTPIIYLLDKNKKIIANKLDIDLLKKVLEMEFKRKEKPLWDESP